MTALHIYRAMLGQMLNQILQFFKFFILIQNKKIKINITKFTTKSVLSMRKKAS